MVVLFRLVFAVTLLAASLGLQACAPYMNSCVVEGTSIDTPIGPVAVEHLSVGDPIWTVRPDGELEVGVVERTHWAIAPSALRIHTENGLTLSVTASHPIGTPAGAFISAGKLAPGDLIRTTTGDRAISRIDDLDRSVRVFDLSVTPNHTFVASGVVVHNKTVMAPASREDLNRNWVGITSRGMLVRLRVEPDGAWLTEGTHSSTRLYRAEGLEEYGRWGAIQLILVPVGFEGPIRVLTGKAYPNFIWFNTRSKAALIEGEFRFQPEVFFFDRIERSEAAIEAAKPGTEAPILTGE